MTTVATARRNIEDSTWDQVNSVPGPTISPHDEVFGGPRMADLVPLQRNFVINYLAGPDGIRGIAYQSYYAAGYNPSNLNSASAAVSQLLRSPKVEAAIAEVQTNLENQARGRLKSWQVLAVKAQTLVERALDREIYLEPGDVAAISMTLDRALGKPTQPIEHEVGNKLDKLIRDLASRPSLPPASPPVQSIIERNGVEVHSLPVAER